MLLVQLYRLLPTCSASRTELHSLDASSTLCYICKGRGVYFQVKTDVAYDVYWLYWHVSALKVDLLQVTRHIWGYCTVITLYSILNIWLWPEDGPLLGPKHVFNIINKHHKVVVLWLENKHLLTGIYFSGLLGFDFRLVSISCTLK